jgi:hypothetical protein
VELALVEGLMLFPHCGAHEISSEMLGRHEREPKCCKRQLRQVPCSGIVDHEPVGIDYDTSSRQGFCKCIVKALSCGCWPINSTSDVDAYCSHDSVSHVECNLMRITVAIELVVKTLVVAGNDGALAEVGVVS